MLKFITFVSLFLLTLSPTKADTLDFAGLIPSGNNALFVHVSGTEIDIGNAALRSEFDTLAVTPLSNNGFGGVCASSPSASGGFGCSGGLEIDFKQSVFDLTFNVNFYDLSDSELTLQGFLDGSLVGEFNPARGAEVPVDFTSLDVLDLLVISYPDTLTSGVHLSDFNFQTVGVSVVPLPAAFPVFLAALAGLGLMVRRRKGTRELKRF